MKYIIVFVLIFTFTFGMKVTHEKWEKGKTFSDYLESHNISAGLLESISKEDQKFLLEIQSNTKYYELINNEDSLIQALIPINREMQIHLFKKRESSGYGFDIIPVQYQKDEYFAEVDIESNPYSDTLKTIKQKKVAERLGQALKNCIDTKNLRKGDQLSFIYIQRTRLGQIYHMPDIKVVSLISRAKESFIYVDEEGELLFTDQPGKKERENIRVVRLTLTAKSTRPDPHYIHPVHGDHYRRITLSSVIRPRNMGL